MDEQYPQDKRVKNIFRKYTRMKEREQRLEVRRAASSSLLKRFTAWAETGEGSQRTFERMKREVLRLCKEIETNPKKHPQIDEATLDSYFTQMKAQVISETQPKKRVSYQQTLAALHEVVTLNTQWLQAQPRSRTEQAQMLRSIRQLLREIEAGHLENIARRFSEAMAHTPTKEQPE